MQNNKSRIPILIWLILLFGGVLFIISCCLSVLISPSSTDTKEKSVEGIITQDLRLKAHVTKVTDGDTVKILLNGQEVSARLVGIDTPELKDPNKPIQCYAQQASENTTTLLLDKDILFQYDNLQGEKDRFDRLLIYVWIKDGAKELFINDYLVREGFAFAYRDIKSDKLDQFIQAENDAKTKEKGVWSSSCKCSTELNKEVSRNCTSCNKATIELKQWDCSSKKSIIDDSSCSNLCEVVQPQPSPQPQSVAPAWACNCAKTCPQLSCAEAQFQLNSCGCGARDNDNDGVACDAQCQ